MSGIERIIDHRSRSGRRLGRATTKATLKSAAGRIREVLESNDGSVRAQARDNDRGSPERSDVISHLPDSSCSQTITVLVADDHPVVREGLIALVNRRPDMRVVGNASNGREAVDKFLALRPDITLLDLRMPIMDGVEAATRICGTNPAAHIIVISSYENEEDIYRVLRAGAQGYLVKDASVDELVECIHTVANGKTWIPPHVAGKLAKRVANQELTRRETEVLQAVTAGKSNKEIGATFNISEATVKVHMTHILEKLKVRSRTEAINAAVKRGLVRLGEAAA